MMKTDEALALVRNPWGHNETLVREARITVCDRLEDAELERNEWKEVAENWKDSAAQFSRNADFYQGIVRQIGKVFGEEARTSDDGSVQDDVLSLKVPELVEALAARVKMQADLLERAQTGLDWYRDMYPEADSGTDDEHASEVEAALADNPNTSLARRDVELLDWVHSQAVEQGVALPTTVFERMAELRRQAEEKPQ